MGFFNQNQGGSLSSYYERADRNRMSVRERIFGAKPQGAVTAIPPQNVQRTMTTPQKGRFSGLKKVGAMAGPAMTGAMVIEPMISTEGGPGDRLMAGVGGAREMAGFEVASNFAGKGAAKFAKSGAGKFALGKHATKVAKWGRISRGATLVGALSLAAEGAYEFQKHLADIGSKQRMSGLEWGKGSPGMDTQRAYTMRQQSLQQMNRGSMSARSLLGREAQYLHQ